MRGGDRIPVVHDQVHENLVSEQLDHVDGHRNPRIVRGNAIGIVPGNQVLWANPEDHLFADEFIQRCIPVFGNAQVDILIDT